MSILLIVIGAVAFWHFIYESILAPSRRFKIRLQLFALRDDFRRKLIEDNDAAGDEAFADIEDSINTTISLCSSISPGLVVDVKRAIGRDPHLRKAIEARRNQLDQCRVVGAQELRKKCGRLVRDAFLVNVTGWSILIVPLILLYALLNPIVNWISTLFAMPSKDLQYFTDDQGRLTYA